MEQLKQYLWIEFSHSTIPKYYKYFEEWFFNVHYEFRNGISAKSFGEEVLERFMEEKDEQEQPEMDLEKFTEKIKTFQEKYKHPEIVSIKGAMAFMARMFYQYPNIARQWYDSLRKVTMD